MLICYLLPLRGGALLSRRPSLSLPTLQMTPGDGEGAAGQDIHHIFIHQSSRSCRDTKLCSLARAFSGIEMRRNESSRLYSHSAPIYCLTIHHHCGLLRPLQLSHDKAIYQNHPRNVLFFCFRSSSRCCPIHIFSAVQVKCGESFFKHIVRRKEMSTYKQDNSAEMHHGCKIGATSMLEQFTIPCNCLLEILKLFSTSCSFTNL